MWVDVVEQIEPAAGWWEPLAVLGTCATTRAGAALPPTRRSGKHETVKPCGGSAPRFTSRSIWE